MSNTKLDKIIFRTNFSRRFPDPLNGLADADPYNIEHHVLLIRAIDIPSGISVAPNPRQAKTNVGIYKEIQASLEDAGDPTFHLKNKGITIFAHKVDVSDDKKVLTAFLGSGDGIADGGHTYKIIIDSQSKNKCPDNQYVRLEIITGIPSLNKVDISGGLNTGVQVQEASLENLQGTFDWIKEELKGTPYGKKIAYMQNEPGEFDIRDILAFMTVFNVEHPSLKGRQPKEAYTSKAACLKLYQENEASYKMLRPILKDILCLHDYIHLNLGKKYNEALKQEGAKGRAHGMVGVFDHKQKGTFKFIFADKESDYKLYDGTFFPIYGAMRYLVKKKGDEYAWKFKSFDDVKKMFDAKAKELLEATYRKTEEFGKKPNPVGKNESHWDYLYEKIVTAYTQQRLAELEELD